MIYGRESKQAMEGDMFILSHLFAHLKLENMLGFDLLSTDDKSFYEKYREPMEKNIPYKEIKEVQVFNHNDNEIYDCIAYIWTYEAQKDFFTVHGLVVLKTDKKGIEHAIKAYENNAEEI